MVHLTNLRNVRREQGLTQSALGQSVGVDQARVSSIEGGSNVSLATATRFAAALGVDVGDLQKPLVRLADLHPEVLALLKK